MDNCPRCTHPLAWHRGEPFAISSQGCGACLCLVAGPTLASAKDFDATAITQGWGAALANRAHG